MLVPFSYTYYFGGCYAVAYNRDLQNQSLISVVLCNPMSKMNMSVSNGAILYAEAATIVAWNWMDQKTQETDLEKKWINYMEQNAYHSNRNCRGWAVGSISGWYSYFINYAFNLWEKPRKKYNQ